MAERNNPYSLKVDLDSENGAVGVVVREKEGNTFKEIDTASFAGAGIHDDIKGQVFLYGLSKLLQDRSSDTKAGPEKLAAMQDVYDQLVDGKWERERKAGSPTVSAEVEALARIKGVGVADIQRALSKFSKEQKEKVFENTEVQRIAAEIRSSRDATEVDLSDL